MLVVLFFLLVPLKLSYADDGSFTVNIPNDQGGYTAIVIKQSGEGYVGPQGEYYSSFPTVYQLKAMYRLGSPSPSPVVTYVQPEAPVQTVVTEQVVYQPVPVQNDGDENEGYYHHDDQPNVVIESGSRSPVDLQKEDAFFDFRKKKEPAPSGKNNQNTLKHAEPLVPSSSAPTRVPTNGNPQPIKAKPAPTPPQAGSPDQKKKPPVSGGDPASGSTKHNSN